MYQASLIFESELSPKTGAKIPQGIHTNCEVVSVEQGDTGKNTFVDINFKDSEGRFHNKRLWSPTGNYPKDGETTADAIKREELSNLSHVVKIVHIFLGNEALAALSAENYQSLMGKLVSKLTPEVLSKKKVNLKLIYDSDGQWSVFGNFPDYVEECIAGQEPKLKFSPWELANRCTLKTAAPATTAYDINKIL